MYDYFHRIFTEFSRNANVDLGKGTFLSNVSFICLRKLNKQEIIIAILYRLV